VRELEQRLDLATRRSAPRVRTCLGNWLASIPRIGQDESVNLESYLNRIAYTGPRAATLEVLNAVQEAHLNAIPYENLDIHLRRRLPLDTARAYEKIVLERRGGWCYEMNGLLAWALRELGFEVQYLSSGVLRPGGVTPDGDHLILCVRLEDGDYLADAGFGDGAIHALPLREGTYRVGFLEYGMERDGDHWIMRNHTTSNTAGFRFSLEPRVLDDFAARCTDLQISSESGFVRTTVCQRMTRDALHTLRGAVLTTLTSSGSSQRTIKDAIDYRQTLLEVFKLNLREAETLWEKIWSRHLEWTQEARG
jgi:N-hydroxyarylamine O-acetyltransferase